MYGPNAATAPCTVFHRDSGRMDEASVIETSAHIGQAECFLMVESCLRIFLTL